jgi:EAL and modified HD-GYP domain-containing signal transduction protein
MNVIKISKQKIFDNKNKVYAYELTFLNSNNEEASLSSSIKETSQLIISAMSDAELDKVLGKDTQVFINVDENTLLRGILDVLDNERFILNILENIELTDKVVSRIIQYKKRGFRFSLEHFDSSMKMIKKFKRLFNFIDIIKMDVILSEFDNLEKVVNKFKGTRIKLLAQNIETDEDYEKYKELEFDYFQGYYLDKPESIETLATKEPAQFIIIKLIKIIKDNDTTKNMEAFIKQHPDLSYKLVEFFNNSKNMDVKIKSLTQVITLMGRDKLLRWLMIYLYSEASKNEASQTILALAIKRAERMEEEAYRDNKDKAYLAGMFSMLSSIFETDIKELMNHINMDKDITSLVLEKKGIFAASLMRAEAAEKRYLKKVMMDNFDKISTADLIYTLEYGGVDIDGEKI